MKKTYELSEIQEHVLEALKTFGFDARWWGPEDEAVRLYFGFSRKHRV